VIAGEDDDVIFEGPGDDRLDGGPGEGDYVGYRTSPRGITFAGQGWGDATFDGELRGRARVERVARRFGAFRVELPPATAALVTARRAG
jgi:hypothetical protein